MRYLAAGLLGIAALASCGPGDDGWDPRSHEILLVSNRDGDSEIYRVQGGQWTNLTGHPGREDWPRWSPDGTRIAFSSPRSGNSEIWVMDADGSGQTQLTDDPAPDFMPTWSPDGSRIAFVSRRLEPGDPEGSEHIYVMNADGSDPRRLVRTPLKNTSGVGWSPDGREIVFTRTVDGGGGDLYLRDLETGDETRLTDQRGYEGGPVFSPDGTTIAFYAEHGGESAIWLVDRDGQNLRRITGGGKHWYPQWSPDGSWVMFDAALDAGGLQLDQFAVPAAGGEPLKLIDTDARKADGSWRPAPGTTPRIGSDLSGQGRQTNSRRASTRPPSSSASTAHLPAEPGLSVLAL